MDDNINCPKKRGRKPKNKENNDDNNTIKRKRGRKPTGKIIELKGGVPIDPNYHNCIIAHLPLNTKDIQKITGETINQTEKSFSSINIDINDEFEMDKTCKQCSEYELENNELKNRLNDILLRVDNLQIEKPERKRHYCDLKLVDSIDGKYKWHQTTDIACWWCCHKFDNIPIGLPEKYLNNTFYLHGCFCSFNCAHAYNIDLNDNRVWERLSLLNYYYSKVNKSDNINEYILNPAPPRQILKLFGGTISIEEFRKNNYFIAKEYHYLLPPLIPMMAAIDEIPKDNPIDTAKINNNNSLKLKRSKPLPSFNSNLLQLMKKT